MPAKPCRKFSVMDLLILIAAVAVGLAWTRYYQRTEAGFESYPDPDDGFFRVGGIHTLRLRIILWWITTLYHCVAVVTSTMLALRLRGPRPKLRRLTSQPGTVACAAATFAIFAELSEQVPSAFEAVRFGDNPWWNIGNLAYWDLQGSLESMAVATCWLLMLCSRRWRREPGWIDGFGIVLGAFWLLASPCMWLAYASMKLH